MPVIAMGAATPAMAASNSACAPVMFSWNSAGPIGAKFITGSAGGVTVSTSVSDPGGFAGPKNGTISPDAGGYNGYTSYYEQQLLGPAINTSAPVTTTLMFSQPVKDLSFSFFDIDRGSADDKTTSYIDGVAITSHSATAGDFTYTNGSDVKGSGTVADPRQGSAGSIGGKTGNANVVFTKAISSFTWTYADLSDKVATQPFIGLSDLTFTPTSC